MSFITVPLGKTHDGEGFSCGKPLLDSYIRKQAGQDVRRKLAACFVLEDGAQIKGYYTLSSTAIERNLVPPEFAKKMPPAYQDLPAILLGRLAINVNYQGQGLGELLLVDALRRASLASEEVGAIAVVVDPIDESAFYFYKRYEFIDLPDSRKLFLPIKTIDRLFG